MAPAERFTYTAHAEEMMAERQIDRAWVEKTVLQPDTTEPDAKHPERVRAFRALPERDGRVLRVVYIPHRDHSRVVTLFLDRG
jgi:hypothetical protein